jgi:hypothetical protein
VTRIVDLKISASMRIELPSGNRAIYQLRSPATNGKVSA